MRSRKIRQLVTDFDELGLHSKDLQADHVFCALGTTIKKAGSQAKFRQVDYDYPLALARITLAEGARHFSLVSALGASVSSPFFYSRVKGELERALQEMDWPGLGIVRPSVIAGERAESRRASAALRAADLAACRSPRHRPEHGRRRARGAVGSHDRGVAGDTQPGGSAGLKTLQPQAHLGLRVSLSASDPQAPRRAR